jgi:hypothetical protein
MLTRHQDVPTKINGVAVIRNGFFYSLAQHDARAVEYMNAVMIPYTTSRWTIYTPGLRDVTELREAFDGKDIYILGLGGSLDALREEHVKRGATILCINESHFAVDSFDNLIINIGFDVYYPKLFLPKSKMLIAPHGINHLHPADILCYYTTVYLPGPTFRYTVEMIKHYFKVRCFYLVGIDSYFLKDNRYSQHKHIIPHKAHAATMLERQRHAIRECLLGLTCQWFDGTTFIPYAEDAF